MMHFYNTLLCIVVHPKRFTIIWGGSLLNHHQCAASTWMMRRLPQDKGASALTTHKLQVERRERVIEPIKCSAHHTPATDGEKRESHRANQVYVLTTHQLQVERRESHRDNQVYVLTTHQLQVERRVIEPIKCMSSPHTSYRQRGERVIEPIKCMRSPHTSYRWRG